LLRDEKGGYGHSENDTEITAAVSGEHVDGQAIHEVFSPLKDRRFEYETVRK
jgi:hypothetical protein